jgi:hypothetical protein
MKTRSIETIDLTSDHDDTIMKSVHVFENKMSHKYPMLDTNDYFTIDHGPNYFNWFNKLGKPKYFYRTNKKTKQIDATACGVLRNINGIKCWYICDVKVDPVARSNSFSYKCLLKAIPGAYFKSSKCFAVCMQPNNAVAHIIEKIFWPTIKESCKINIYLLTNKELTYILDDLVDYYGSGFILESNMSVKDITLESSKKVLQVLHVKKTNSDNIPNLSNYSQHKFFVTVIDKHLLNDKISNKLFGSAIIYSYQMDDFDWKLLSSAEI